MSNNEVIVYGVFLFGIIFFMYKSHAVNSFVQIVIAGIISIYITEDLKYPTLSAFIVFFILVGVLTKLNSLKEENPFIKKTNKRNNDINETELNNKKESENLAKYIIELKKYGKYVEMNPLSFQEIKNINSLPIIKDELINDSIKFINKFEEPIQTIILSLIPELAFYRETYSENGYRSHVSKLIDSENSSLDTMINNLEETTEREHEKGTKVIDDLAKELSNDAFPKKLYEECEKESKEIEYMLRKALVG